MNVVKGLILAGGVLGIAQAPLTMHLAVRVPSLISVGADATTEVLLLGALRDADALCLFSLCLTHSPSLAMDLRAGIQVAQANHLFDVLLLVLTSLGLNKLLKEL